MTQISSQVCDYYQRLTALLEELRTEAAQFVGGRLRDYLHVWEQVTSDREILQIVQGAKLEFTDTTELPTAQSTQPGLNHKERDIIHSEIEKLKGKKVISPCSPLADQFLSPVFTRPKKDGSHRMILNLKNLNQDIEYHHFKMDTLLVALTLITPGCFMASIDLKDAYYSLPIDEQHRKFLRFRWKGQLWQYDCMPNGLALAPRKFTKLLKPVYAQLREQGHVSTAFLDDSLLVADSELSCVKNIQATVQLLRSLGFIIHPEKSVLVPSQTIQYLGVVINSSTMTVTLTDERKASLVAACAQVLKAGKVTIRDLAKVIGKIVASFPAVRFGPLHYRHLEDCKKAALREAKGDYDSHTSLTPPARDELKWWLDNTPDSHNEIVTSDPEITIKSDASGTSWGCECERVRSGGNWLPVETQFHINYLELLAAFIALKCFEKKVSGKHVRLMLDNTNAISWINKMGTSRSESGNQLTFAVWEWCRERGIWLSAAHIPGVLNTEADEESRKINTDTEWKLDSQVLQSALKELECFPTVDLFASRLNTQFERYVSFRPDPEAFAVDAFSISWQSLQFYAFPPFSVIARVLQKARRDKARGVIVVPRWPTQVWWPVLGAMMVAEPIHLPSSASLLSLPSHPGQTHRLLPKMRLMACLISGSGSIN